MEIEQHQNYVIRYPSQSTTNNLSTYGSHPPTQAIDDNQKPNDRRCRSTITKTVGITAFSILFVMFLLSAMQPFIPEFRVDPTTIAILNVSNNGIIADWDVGFSILNTASESFVYDHINASMFYGTRRLSNTTLEPIEHRGKVQTIAWGRFAAVPVDVEEWLVNDTAMDGPRGSTHLTFVFQARARYRGFTWPIKRDTIKFVCENKKVVFPSNTTKTMEFRSGECNIHERWSKIRAPWPFCFIGLLILLLMFWDRIEVASAVRATDHSRLDSHV